MSCPEFVFEIFALQKFRDEQGESYDDTRFVKEALAVAIQEQLSECQRKYFLAYYAGDLPIWGIAKKYGVNQSTVSREIKRAREKLWAVMRYSHPRLLHTQMQNSNVLRGGGKLHGRK